MRRGWIPLLVIVTVVAALWIGPVLAPTYTVAYNELAQTFTALKTFGAGANVTGGYHRDATSLNVAADSQIGFEGQSGDTYTKRDADTGTLDTYKDGTASTIDRGTSWRPPLCPEVITEVGFCFDAATGRIKVRDAAGVRELP